MNIAIIKTGGKQYVVKPGQKVKIEKINEAEGKKVSFETLLQSDEPGSKLAVGKPSLGQKVEAKVLKQRRNKKVRVVKYKSKTRHKVTTGHRQNFTEVEITKV